MLAFVEYLELRVGAALMGSPDLLEVNEDVKCSTSS